MSAFEKRRRSDPVRAARRPAADLHVHTTHSDGACTPGDVVRAAATVGLSALAITDHDTVSAYAVALPEARRLGVELIPGVELTAEHDGKEIHLLGYGFEPESAELQDACQTLRDGRTNRILGYAEKLGEVGYRVSLEDLRRQYPRACLGRKHLAEYLVRSGQVTSLRQVFQELLGDGGRVQVPKVRLGAEEAIALVRRSGGISALAHPRHDLRESSLKVLVDFGLDGIEVRGPGVTAALTSRRRKWAEQFGLLSISGSDFHAPDRPGRWVGSIVTEEADLNRLLDARGAARSSIVGQSL